MSSIKVKYFGPIKEGYPENDGWLDIKNVTVFIGNQGSGKSTIAKLISTLMWMEKALVRGSVNKEKLPKNWFQKQCSYQNIENYFKNNTEVYYKGECCVFTYTSNQFQVEMQENPAYKLPKIMYIPSERNLVSVLRNVNSLKGLPPTLYTFADEFLNAVETLKGEIDLPISKTKFEYQQLNKLSWIVGEDYKIKLSESSSGFQSFVPMYLVTQYLAESLNSENNEMSIEDVKRMRKEMEVILSNPKFSEEVKQNYLAILSSKYSYGSFINIVEEPEQNLFPSSQRKMLNMLLKYVNMNEGNKLVMTTHSPYLINYLSIAIQADYVAKLMNEQHPNDAGMRNKLNDIAPFTSHISAAEVIVYQLVEKEGTITVLPNLYGIPSDKNYLNEGIKEGNELFDSLLEIEQTL